MADMYLQIINVIKDFINVFNAIRLVTEHNKYPSIKKSLAPPPKCQFLKFEENKNSTVTFSTKTDSISDTGCCVY